jgi:hypothetical protein
MAVHDERRQLYARRHLDRRGRSKLRGMRYLAAIVVCAACSSGSKDSDRAPAPAPVATAARPPTAPAAPTGPVAGTFDNVKFVLAKALVAPGGALVLSDHADITCKALISPNPPALPVPPEGVSIMFRYAPRAAGSAAGTFRTNDHGRESHRDIEGLTVVVDHYSATPGEHVVGSLRGIVSGTFDAEVCSPNTQ